jgi:Fe-S cluster assembly protein SufD
MASPLATRIAEEHAAASAALPEEVVSRDRRRSAIERLKVEGLPTSRDENWKYANLRPLEKVRFAPAAAGAAIAARAAAGAPSAHPPAAALTIADLPPSIEGYARYAFVDGVFAPALSAPVIKAGISVASLRSSAAELGGLAVGSNPAPATKQTAVTAIGSAENTAAKDARFALLNDAFAVDGVAIHVSAGIDCPTCIELVFVASVEAQVGSSYPRVELHVAKDARLGLIERHVSIGGTGANFINAAVKVDLARGATLNHYRVQESGSKAIWFDTLSAVLAQDATYKLHGVSVGGQSSRSTITVQLAGERADARVSVASLGDRQQIQDAFVLIEHTAPNTRSEQTFRGIAAGRARVAFNGKVVVRKGAQGTDSQQSLRGLLAGPEAEIDVRPQLEIYTDDVRCAHGATTGKLDDNMLFYLLSRGIDRATAQRLLKWAFLEDVVARIEVPELRRQIERSLAGQMQEAAELKELL